MRMLPKRTRGWSHKLIGFPFLNGDSPQRALTQTGSQTVTISIRQYLGLAVHHDNGPLSARGDAQAATVTLFLIYLNNLPFSHILSSHLVVLLLN
jgi:hypothetical protein